MNDDRTLLPEQIRNLPTRGPKGTIHTDDYLTGHRDARHAAAELAAAALSAAPAQEPTLSEDDVHTLIGHAIFLRMEGKLDMPAYFFGLATRIAKQIGDAALAARAEELSASPLPQEPQEGKAGEWLPIESAPKDGAFLVANAKGNVCACQSRDGQRIVHNMPVYADWMWGDDATHWQPLPPPPSATLSASSKGEQR